jgi:hypothetical protein
MKTFTKISLIVFAMVLATHAARAQKVLSFEGLYSQGEGGAAWNADGTGPEPYGNGHGGIYYYTATRDYVDPASSAGAHMLDNIIGFPLFEQALINNGFAAAKVTVKISLASLGDDVEGIDWFSIGGINYSNFYPIVCTFELDGEPMVEALGNYAIYKAGGGSLEFESAYLKVNDISSGSSDPVQIAAAALLDDLANDEVRFDMQVSGVASLTGNGRTGGYFNVNLTVKAGLPTFPFKGLYADNEGVAAWNADGTGPEPYGNGHLDFLYYGASVDYDGINPNFNACLGHCLVGSKGFLNTLLQLQYRNFEIGDMKMKMGLSSLGPDVEGEDWGYINGTHWLNQYNNSFIIEINGEPILEVMQDTNTMLFVDPANLSWTCKTSVGKVYNISDNASADAQFVALSFLRDLGSHYLKTEVLELSYAGSFSGNGRSGAYYQIDAGELTGVHENITFIPPGEVSGTWTAEGSPYYVDGHLEIANGETLIIEPEVKVAVRGPYHFTVQGCVKAEGTEDENIIFTRSNPNFHWEGFAYDETPSTNETSVFDQCLFEYGSGRDVFPFNCGGAFSIRGYDNVHISSSTFRYNKADLGAYPGGGAISLWESSPVIRKCIFYENYGLSYGGAILIYLNSNPVISNCLFYENNSIRGGALTFYENNGGIVINNTIADNYASTFGGALYLLGNSGPQIINNIIWNNEANNAGGQVFNSGVNNLAGYFYNNIEGGLSGFGGTMFNGSFLFNLDEDPLFTNDPGLLYMISGSSPCYNAGTPDTSAWYYPQHLPATCLCGNPRKCYDRIDMGAFEFLEPGGIRDQKSPVRPFVVQPNPFMDYITVSMDLNEPSDVSLYIYSSMGALLAQKDYSKLQAGQKEQRWYLSSLPEGIYLLAVKINNERFTQKVLKTK